MQGTESWEAHDGLALQGGEVGRAGGGERGLSHSLEPDSSRGHQSWLSAWLLSGPEKQRSP